MLTNDEFSFDLSAIRSEIEARIPREGRLEWRADGPDRAHGLLIPPSGSPGSPIILTAVADVVIITAGLGARQSYGGAQPGDEGLIADIVEAIIQGGATEYALVDMDGTYAIRLAIESDQFRSMPETRGATKVRRIPAW